MHWLELLNLKVAQQGRRMVEETTGISKTTLSQVLNQKYPGNLDNIEAKVLSAYTSISVVCPVLGEIAVRRCNAEQLKPFSFSNPQRVKLFRACMNCPHRTTKQRG